MTLIKKLLITLGILSIMTLLSLSYTGYMVYDDWATAKQERALNDARRAGEIAMLNSIYNQANSRGQVTLASITAGEDGQVERGTQILLRLVPQQPTVVEP